MSKSLYIPIILGTAREGRESEKVARYVVDFFKSYKNESTELVTEFIDVRDFQLTHTNDKPEKYTPAIKDWQKKAERADGFIIVSPEYNSGYPGELKMFIDSLYPEYNRKPLAIVAVSNGPFAGAHMTEQLKLTVEKLGMAVVRKIVHFGNVPEAFDSAGVIKDRAVWDKRMKELADELVWWARTLTAGRTS